jgi:Tol biopolymer transport system component
MSGRFRRLSALLPLLLCVAPAPLAAQYFGQNKVQYQAFGFKVIKTEHFDVYFYDREREAAYDIARMAERSYGRLSRLLNHQFRERKPIIVYASHSDFIQTNATPGEVGEGTGGFTDFLKHRNIFPLTGSYAENEHVLTHEMVHQFQYDIYSGGKAGGGLGTLMAVNPPLWFMEGMAEYLAIGPVDPNTAMWLRDASLENNLPSIRQMETDPRIFPYRFGEALMAYVGQRWGDEAIGAILSNSRVSGLDGAFRRTIGLSLDQLSQQWRDAVLRKYLPEIGTRTTAAAVAQPLLTEANSDGTLHLAPAVSPDGSRVAYFSEANSYFVDLYLANGRTGARIKRLYKSTFDSNYETFRFINSSASWSPDGKYIVVAAKRGPRDEILVIDVDRNRVIDRIRVDLDGITTPSFSPDGRQLVFTGYDGGIADLFIVNRDGGQLRRLTNDKYAEFDPVWSPDGKTIAFTTDRGPKTDFDQLTFGNFRIGLYDVATGAVRLLDHMDLGKNSSPQWAPDGKSIAFISDRTGVSNVFLYDFGDGQIYQLTDLYTGAQGITPLSPVLSWGRGADRLAFVYYEKEKYDVYAIDHPRSLKRAPWTPASADSASVIASIGAEGGREAVDTAVASQPADAGVGVGGSLYRAQEGFRAANKLGAADSTRAATGPVSVVALLDSATLNLPDTSEFSVQPYRVHFTPDYVARPSIGYERDTFGRGFFGGSAIQLSDMLGNQQMVFAGYVNGSFVESQLLAAYANLSHRLNWMAGASQTPYYFLEPSEIIQGQPSDNENTFVTHIRRIVVREAFIQAAYPFSRFRRVELSLRADNIKDDDLQILEPYDPLTGYATRDAELFTEGNPGANYVQPAVALVHDNTLFGYTGPFRGRRWRFEVGQTVGTWHFTQLLGDYRRYDPIAGPIVLASRAFYFGRQGRDANQFLLFAGTTDLLRGQTSGSYVRNECRNAPDDGGYTGCAALDRLVGTQLAVGNVELRFPILTQQIFPKLPLGIPPIEGALFYDVGLAWDQNSTVKWSEASGDAGNPDIRVPLQSWGLSARMNVLGLMVLRLDWSHPLHRPGVGSLWTVSLGPTF